MIAATAMKVAVGSFRALSAIFAAGVQQLASSASIANPAPVTAADNATTTMVTATTLTVKGSAHFRVTADVSGVGGAGYTGLGQLAIFRSVNGAGAVRVATSDFAGTGAAQVAASIDVIDPANTGGAVVGSTVTYTARVILPAVAATNTITSDTGLAQITVEEIPNP